MPACIVCFRTWASILNIVGSACVALGVVVINEISCVIRMLSTLWPRLLFLDICCTVILRADVKDVGYVLVSTFGLFT